MSLYDVVAGQPIVPTDVNQIVDLLNITANLPRASPVGGGPPIGGPYLVRDWAVDPQGFMWICYQAGSPGLWLRQYGPLKKIYSLAATSGSATGFNFLVRDVNVFTPPFAYTMVLRFSGACGFGASVNTSTHRFSDNGSVDITVPQGVGINHPTAAVWLALSLAGKKQYSANTPCSFTLDYMVDSGNVYTQGMIELEIYPGAL